MKRDGIISGVAAKGWILIIEDRLSEVVQTQELSRWSGVPKAANDCMIDKIVKRRIFINTAAKRTIDRLIHLKIPNFRCHSGIVGCTPDRLQVRWGFFR